MIDFLKKEIPVNGKVLDVACGYGRLTIPLQKTGYFMEGIDIASNLINAAKNKATKEKLNIKFRVGDMRDLPHKEKSFDAVICIWSSFCHMLTKTDQIRSLKEMYRVIRNGGSIIIDFPFFTKPTKKLLKQGSFVGRSSNLFKSKIKGLELTLFLHTKKSLLDVLNATFGEKLKTLQYSIKFISIGGKRRIILKLIKCP